MAASKFNTFLGDSQDSSRWNLKKTIDTLALWIAAGLLPVVVYALSQGEVGRWYIHNAKAVLEICGYGTLLAIASLAVGSLFGFLFGIPRTIQGDERPTGSEYRQAVNTNLEQISDWLTKILVGVGLTQLNNLPSKLWMLADNLKSGLNNSQALTLCVVLNFLVCGFFAGYLVTRLFLAGAFVDADRGARGLLKAARKKEIEVLETELDEAPTNLPTTQQKDAYEKLTYNYLYEDAPEGFTKAIELGNKYVAEKSAASSPKIWSNLALAYGQQYRWELSHGKSENELKASRLGALQAIREALKLEPKMLSLLRTVWDPNDPTKQSSEENDLEVFYGDKEFKDILGVSPQ